MIQFIADSKIIAPWLDAIGKEHYLHEGMRNYMIEGGYCPTKGKSILVLNDLKTYDMPLAVIFDSISLTEASSRLREEGNVRGLDTKLGSNPDVESYESLLN